MNETQVSFKKTENSSAFVLKVSVVAALGGLLFGYDTAVIAGVIGFLEQKFSLTPAMVGWAASSAIWGCIFGAMFAGYMSDRLGRKKVLIITAILFAVSSVGSAIPNDLATFIAARFIGGLGIGAASMLSPLYIAEIAPSDKRGRLVTLYQLAIVLGINLIYFVNMQIAGLNDEAWNVDVGWRYMIGSGVIPAILFFVLLFFVPESPRWLVKRGKFAEAMDTLSRVNGSEKAGLILDEIKTTLQQESGTLKELFAPGLRRAMVIGIMLGLFSQITGINAIIYYAPEILKTTGIGAGSAFFQTFLIGIVNTIFTFVALWLVDRAGRRKLLLGGTIGMVICLLGTGICFYFGLLGGPWLLLFILGYIACFASSLGPIPWIIMSEIFPTKTRGIAMSVVTLILWIGVVLVTQLTPVMLESLGGAFTFWLFMVNAIILLIFAWLKIPETKNRTLEEIERSWKRD